MDDPRDRVVDIARRLSRRMNSFNPQGQMGDLHREMKEALAELDAEHPFECQLCGVRFMTKPELDGHQYSASHLKRLSRPSPHSLCTG